MTVTIPDHFTLRTLVVAVILAALVCLFVYAQFQRRNSFDFWDLITDKAGRASLDSVITLVCCAVGIWYVVARSNDPTFDMTGGAGSFLTNLIMIMVIYRGVKGGVQAWKEKLPAINLPPAPPGPQIGQQVINQVDGGDEIPLTAKPPSAVKTARVSQ